MTIREVDGTLNVTTIMERPLDDRVDDTSDEVAQVLIDYMPSPESIGRALYNQSGLAARNLREWLARTEEFTHRHTSQEHNLKLTEQWLDTVDRITK